MYLWKDRPLDWLGGCLGLMAMTGLSVHLLLAPFSPDTGSGDGLVHPYVTIFLSLIAVMCGAPLGLLMLFLGHTRTVGGFLCAMALGLGLGLWFALPR